MIFVADDKTESAPFHVDFVPFEVVEDRLKSKKWTSDIKEAEL